MTFDYIIIGAGSAGCVLANRLSANPKNTVLLLEAGPKDKKLEIQIPGAYTKLHRSEVDWAFWTEPQDHVDGRRIYIPRGKTLGGSSSTNAMAYVRGNPADFDEWEALGNKGWSYKDVLPFFKKSEANAEKNADYCGKNGPLHVAYSPQPHFLGNKFLEACEGAGIRKNPDYNGPEQLGASMLQFTIKDNKRQSTATAFLKPVLHRGNLSVKTEMKVSKILLEQNRAIGVEVIDKDNKIETFICGKEVVLSAGAIQSPQIMMLSGIGDRAYLEKFGIETRHDLPGVGQNLVDHVWSGLSAWSNVPTDNHYTKPLQMGKEMLRYLFFKKGPFGNSILTANAFLSSIAGQQRQDIQFHFAVSATAADYSTDIYDIRTFPKKSGFSILVILLKPKSSGFVGLKSKDPLSDPLIQPNLLSDAADLEKLIWGFERAKSVMEAPSLRSFHEGKLYLPKAFDRNSLESHIRRTLETLYHPVGTCRMGNDRFAVVDEKLQVRGINGLRIADASVMPTIVSGNTNAACIMIGEKAADMILHG